MGKLVIHFLVKNLCRFPLVTFFDPQVKKYVLILIYGWYMVGYLNLYVPPKRLFNWKGSSVVNMVKSSQLSPLIKFSSLKLDQAVFQVQAYNKGVLLATLPDFWEDVEARLDTTIFYGTRDGVSVCRLEKKTELSINQEQFSVVEFEPANSLAKFIKTSEHFFNAVREFLRMERINRVGFRLIYSMDFDSPDAVAHAFTQLPYVVIPEKLSLSKHGKMLIPTFNFGWGDDKKGIVYRLKGNASKLTVDLPLQMSLSGEYPEQIEKVYNQFIFDVDVFISGPILPDEFLPQEWLVQAYEAVNMDGSTLFA